jgi:hypothetical protein
MRAHDGRARIAGLLLLLPIALAACGHAGAAAASAPTNAVPLATPQPSGAPVPPLDRTERFAGPAQPDTIGRIDSA